MRLGPVAVLALLPIGCGSEQASEFASALPANDDATLASALPAVGDPCTPGDTFDCTCKTVTCPKSGAWDQDCADCPDCPPCSAPNVPNTGGGCTSDYIDVGCGCCVPKPLPVCTSAACCDAGSVLLPIRDAAGYVCESCRRIVGGTPDRDGDCSPGLTPSRGCCLPPYLVDAGADGAADAGADASDGAPDAGVATASEASSDAGPESSDATPEASPSDTSASADAADDVADARAGAE